MKLTLFERVNILAVLPQKGAYLELRKASHINELIGPSAEEMERTEAVWAPSGDFSMNPQKDFEVNFDFQKEDIIFLKKILTEMDERKILPATLLSAYEKFMDAPVLTEEKDE